MYLLTKEGRILEEHGIHNLHKEEEETHDRMEEYIRMDKTIKNDNDVSHPFTFVHSSPYPLPLFHPYYGHLLTLSLQYLSTI